MKNNIYVVDSIDAYNKLYNHETLHPLVTVLDINESPEWMNGATIRYAVYGIFLKQGDGCSARYGREKYDYQEVPSSPMHRAKCSPSNGMTSVLCHRHEDCCSIPT